MRGERQTNQRAELVAIARALDHVPIDRDVEIRTDSYYSIRCLREWFQNWETKGWRNAAGKSVENKELIQPILARIRERLTCRGKTTFTWVKGHGTDPGNIAADALANEGMDKWTPELTSGTPFDMSETLRTKYTLPSLTKPKQEDGDEFGEDPFKDYFDDLEAERMANELADSSHTTVPVQASIDAEEGARAAVQKNREVWADNAASSNAEITERTLVVSESLQHKPE